MSKHEKNSSWDAALIKEALTDSVRKLSPKTQMQNPVMFLVYLGSILTTVLWVLSLLGHYHESAMFTGCTAFWLWVTVLFANFAEALAEGRAKAQATALKSLKKSTMALKIDASDLKNVGPNITGETIESTELRRGDVVLVKAGDIIPCDGEVIKGIASVNESAITGESAPVIRESGGDMSSVTGGTTVLTDWIVVRAEVNPGESFVDRMIGMVEGAERRKTPNEIALTILLITLTIVFYLVSATLLPFSEYSVSANHSGTVIGLTVLIALLVCLIPTTIGGLLSAIGVAGMSRLLGANVIARSGRAVEASGDIDVLLLDKTGTITYGNRHATDFYPLGDVSVRKLIETSVLSSIPDDTPEGKSIVALGNKLLEGDAIKDLSESVTFVPFTAQSRMSGVNFEGRQIRKGAPDTIIHYVKQLGGFVHSDVTKVCDEVAGRGSTPLLVCDNNTILGVIELKDVVKPGISDKFAEMRRMGIKTVMITGDNPLTAASIASEAGVDDFLAEATPEAKLKKIHQYQSEGHLVAMTGDGTNDAPALAQADVAVAMNSGTQAAKEAANMVDLDSSPAKLIDVVRIGKQMLMTRGALTTFSIANDIAKYFAIIPAAFASTYPGLGVLNVMNLASPVSALLSAVIFNALIIVCLIPLALRGVTYRAQPAASLLRRNLLVYGLGGIIVPFIGIKLIDLLLVVMGIV